MSDDPETAYWQHRAALLDPAAYEYAVGAGWSRTVPADTCWWALNLWLCRNGNDRVNMATNPAPRTLTGWFCSAGQVDGAATPSIRTTTNYPAPWPQNAIRLTWTAPSSTPAGFISTALGAVAGFTPGGPASFTFMAQASKAQRVHVRLAWFTAAGTLVSQSNTPATVLAANTPTVLTLPGLTVPASATQAEVILEVEAGAGAASWAVGEWLEMGGLLAEAAAANGSYFDGNTARTTAGDVYHWGGPNDAAVSVAGKGFLFHRTADANAAIPLSAGTVVSTAIGVGGFAYLCKPETVTVTDPRYTDDPRGLYYARLAKLRSLPQKMLTVAVLLGSAYGTSQQAAFPAGFTRGMVIAAMAHETSWVTLTNASGGINLLNEISDDHQNRAAQAIMVPFTVPQFTGIRTQAASTTGQVSGFSSLPGAYASIRYVPLPDDF